MDGLVAFFTRLFSRQMKCDGVRGRVHWFVKYEVIDALPEDGKVVEGR